MRQKKRRNASYSLDWNGLGFDTKSLLMITTSNLKFSFLQFCPAAEGWHARTIFVGLFLTSFSHSTCHFTPSCKLIILNFYFVASKLWLRELEFIINITLASILAASQLFIGTFDRPLERKTFSWSVCYFYFLAFITSSTFFDQRLITNCKTCVLKLFMFFCYVIKFSLIG